MRAGRDQVATSPYGLLGGMGTDESLLAIAAGAMGRYLRAFTGDWHWTHLGDPELRGLFLSPLILAGKGRHRGFHDN